MSREYGYGQGQTQEPMVWERVEWRQGDGRYVFEVAQGGLLASLSSPHGTKLTLPMVAWEGLLDALTAARKTKARAERNLPSRTGARWSEVETQELAKTFKAGGSIAQLARVHNRTQFAVEAQLERQGLWDRVERRPTARTIGGHLPAAAPVNTGRPAVLPPAADGRHDTGEWPPSDPAHEGQSTHSAPAAGRRYDPGQQPASGAVDAHWPPASAPAAGRRHDPAQQPPPGAMDAHRPPASASSGGGHHDTGQQPPSGQLDARPPRA